MNFKDWIVSEYSCAGMTVNADLWWNDFQEFLTTRSYKILERILLDACKKTKINVTDHKLLSYQGQLHPEWGYSYLVVLDQSHIMVHTWPENNLMNIDIFTCGNEGNPKLILDAVIKETKPANISHKKVQRGVRKDIRSVNDV